MGSDPTSNHSPKGGPGDSITAAIGAVGVTLSSMAALPQTFERYPIGTAILVALAVFALLCWVTVNWLRYRRG
jgi:uncharacterized protein with PQ loop repeat